MGFSGGGGATHPSLTMSGKRRTKLMKNQPIVAAPAVTTSAGVVLADWQRLPTKILHEHIQKTKIYARPEYHKSGRSEDGAHRCRVVLKHFKNDDRTMKFVPNEARDSFELAKEFAALLALKRLCGDLALDRKLPEPFKSAWLSLSSATPEITTDARFHSDYDRQQVIRDSAQQKKRSENIKEARKHFQSAQKTRLMIDDDHRQMLEYVLQRSTSQGQINPVAFLLPKVATMVSSELARLGFQQEDIEKALAEAAFSNSELNVSSARSIALQWLLINIPDRRLPEVYRGNGPSVKIAMRGAIDADHLPVVVQLHRLGYPNIACETAASRFPESFHSAKLYLWSELIEHLSPGASSPMTGILTDKQLQEETDSERRVLSAIFEDAFVIIDERIWELHVADLQLLIRIEMASSYPSAIPIIDIVGDQLSAIDRIVLQQAVIVQVAVAARAACSPVVYSCVDFLQQNLQHVLDTSRPRWPQAWILAALPVSLSPKITSKSARKPATAEARVAVDSSLNEFLKEKWRKRSAMAEYATVLKGKSRLPVWRHRHTLIEAVDKNKVVVFCAETGSGKSTQIPAFLLDHDVERGCGAACRIICTQPRRISAVSLAERVAHEYCEKVGDTIGYRIRLESKTSKDTRVEYVTNGLLLRQLLSDPTLGGVSHVVIDEVHERSVGIDLLLLVLRQVVERRRNFKLVLMSATLQSNLLSLYFSGCPVVQIPGRAFPVNVLHVEELVEQTGYTPSARYRVKSRSAATGADLDGFASESTRSCLQHLNLDVCNTELMVVAIWHVLSNFLSETGAILCFLPGVGEIFSAIRQFQRSIAERQRNPVDFMLVALHGRLSTSEQSRVFQCPPASVRKIIFATNVAETSITVDDVVFVIDSGRMRQAQFDVERNVSMLVDTLVSQSNAEQRRGRAGRVRSGTCIRLFSKRQYNDMKLDHLCELSRVALDHVCLQIRGLLVWTAPLVEILSKMIEPPDRSAVDRAVRTLRSIGAFEPDSEKLTGLGRNLCSLPVDARLGKMMILSACFSCVTPIIRIAALLSVPSPFLGAADLKDDVTRTRLRYAGSSCSDHIALLTLFEAWLAARGQSAEVASQFCADNFVNDSALKSALDLSRQYHDSLAQVGFVSSAASGKDSVSRCNHNSREHNLLTAVLAAGLYPNVLKVRYPEQRFHQTLYGAVPKAHDSRSVKYYRSNGERAYLHPASVNFQATYPYPFLAYLEQRLTSKLYVYDSSVMAPYSLLMFAERIDPRFDENHVLVDRWIKLDADGRVCALISRLRRELDQLLAQKCQDPGFDIASHCVTKAIVTLLISGGGFA